MVRTAFPTQGSEEAWGLGESVKGDAFLEGSKKRLVPFSDWVA